MLTYLGGSGAGRQLASLRPASAPANTVFQKQAGTFGMVQVQLLQLVWCNTRILPQWTIRRLGTIRTTVTKHHYFTVTHCTRSENIIARVFKHKSTVNRHSSYLTFFTFGLNFWSTQQQQFVIAAHEKILHTTNMMYVNRPLHQLHKTANFNLPHIKSCWNASQYVATRHLMWSRQPPIWS